MDLVSILHSWSNCETKIATRGSLPSALSNIKSGVNPPLLRWGSLKQAGMDRAARGLSLAPQIMTFEGPTPVCKE